LKRAVNHPAKIKGGTHKNQRNNYPLKHAPKVDKIDCFNRPVTDEKCRIWTSAFLIWPDLNGLNSFRLWHSIWQNPIRIDNHLC
jgi:hypothetical protein